DRDVGGTNLAYQLGGELRPRQREMPPVHDRERPLLRHERGDARQGRLEEGAVAEDPAVLLGDGRAGDEPRERLEAGAVAAPADEGPEVLRRRHPAASMRVAVPALRRTAAVGPTGKGICFLEGDALRLTMDRRAPTGLQLWLRRHVA